MTHNFDLLNKQIERAESLLKLIKCPYTASYERIYWAKHGNVWHIMFGDEPLTSAPIAERIECVASIPGLRDELVKAKAEAFTDAGKQATELETYLDFLERQLKS